MEPLESRRLLTATVWIAEYGAENPAAEGLVSQPQQPQFRVFAYYGGEDAGKTLSIPYHVGGTATKPGGGGPADHDLADGTLTLVLGRAEITAEREVAVNAVRDNFVEGDETVTVALDPGADYAFGSPPPWLYGSFNQPGPNPAEAGIAIGDDPPVVRVQTLDPNAAEPDGSAPADTGDFRVTRSGGDTSQPLTVYLKVDGTATPPDQANPDYIFSSNVEITHSLPVAPPTAPPPPMRASASGRIPPPNPAPLQPPPTYAKAILPALAAGDAGPSAADVVVTPVADDHVEEVETIALTAQPTPNNKVGGPAAVPVNLRQGAVTLQAVSAEPGWNPQTQTLTVTRPPAQVATRHITLIAKSGGIGQKDITFDREFTQAPQVPFPQTVLYPGIHEFVATDNTGKSDLAIDITNHTTPGTYQLQVWHAPDKSDSIFITLVVN